MKFSRNFYVYILASKKNGTLYIGVTSNLKQRTYEHKKGLKSGFTKKYNVKILVYYEQCYYINDALIREKQLKHWNRQWKINLIEKYNSNWCDLYDNLFK